MSENPVPETLETIAARIEALSKSNDERFARIDHQFAETGGKIEALSKSSDERFDKIDQRFTGIDQRFTGIDQRFTGIDQRLDKVDQRFPGIDQQLVEMKAQLGVKIEAVDAKVDKVYDAVIAMREGSKRNATEHKTFTKRLDNHDVRILALEKPGPRKP